MRHGLTPARVRLTHYGPKAIRRIQVLNPFTTSLSRSLHLTVCKHGTGRAAVRRPESLRQTARDIRRGTERGRERARPGVRGDRGTEGEHITTLRTATGRDVTGARPGRNVT